MIWFLVKCVQAYLLIQMSLKVIKSPVETPLSKLFTTIKLPTIILIIFLIIDRLINIAANNYNDYQYNVAGGDALTVDDYNMSCSLTVNYVWIYLVSIINNLRLFIKLKNVNYIRSCRE